MFNEYYSVIFDLKLYKCCSHFHSILCIYLKNVKEMRQPKEAEQDYTKAIQYLDGPDGDKADPGERPASR